MGNQRSFRLWSPMVAVSLALAWPAGAQEKVWVTSANTKIVASPSATATAVAAVPPGAGLTVLSTSGKWVEVATDAGQKGWVYRGKVSATPPASGGGGLLGGFGKSSIDVASADTSRSIRGLSPEAEQYAQGAKTPAEIKAAVDQTMALKIGPKDVEQFLKDGKIGEFAE